MALLIFFDCNLDMSRIGFNNDTFAKAPPDNAIEYPNLLVVFW